MQGLDAYLRLKKRLLIALVCALLVVGVGCSNPLSSGKSDNLQSFHSKNVNCDELKFSDSQITSVELRSLIHCINAQGEIAAFETLINHSPDQDFDPIAAALSELLNHQPQYLYRFREAYRQAQKNGDLRALENTVSALLVSPERNRAVVIALQKISTPLSEAFMDPKLSFSSENTNAFLRSRAYQRLAAEYFRDDSLAQFLQLTIRYLNSPDAKPLPALFDFIANAGLDTSWKQATASNEQMHLQNIAHFFDWVVGEGHYAMLSKNIREINETPIQCFAGGKTVANPLASILPQITALDAKNVKRYFNHDLKNLYLTAQAYCDFPYQKTEGMKLVEAATDVRGFDEVFTIIKPLLKNPEFIQFLGSDASAQFMTGLAAFTQKHFFQDFFTLVTLDNQNPLTNNGEHFARLINDVLKPLQSSDVNAVIDFLQPVLNGDAAYGSKLSQVVDHIGSGFPAVPVAISDDLRDSVKKGITHILQRPELAPVFDLSENLIKQGKLTGIFDQFLSYLSHSIEGGKFTHTDSPSALESVWVPPASLNYLLEKIHDPSSAAVSSECNDLSYDWNFNQFSTNRSVPYMKELDGIQACIDPNPTLASLKDLATYAMDKSEFGPVLQYEKSFVSTLLRTQTDLAFTTAEDFISLKQVDLDSTRKWVAITSSLLANVKDSFLKRLELRKLVNALIAAPVTYQAIGEFTEDPPARLRSSRPTLDLLHLKFVNAIVTRTTRLNQVPVAQAIKAIMAEYCPSLDIQQADCDIDSDQVELYQQSPELLFEQIVREELASSQSWLSPKNNSGWTHTLHHPTKVSDLEFHLNPTLHLLRKSPQTPQGLLTAFSRIQNDHLGLAEFIESRAVRFFMIPYLYQTPGYPANGVREYESRIRIRMVNDLDRLELISINADFKAFGVVNNIGMGFLREIALAWGDVPASERPKTLSKFVADNQVKTLSTVKDFIEDSMNRYDRDSLQALGNCDPRGRGVLGRIWATHLCSNEIADVSARIFNLRFLISLLSDEVPVKDGGSGGLVFLRDLFYSLYEANTDAERDQFANGVDLTDACLGNPLSSADVNTKCQKDLLTLVPRIAHLGLIHEASLAVVNSQDHPISAAGLLIDRLTANPVLSDLFIKTASSDAGIQLLADTVDYGFQAPVGTGKNLSLLTQVLALPQDLNWMNFAFEFGLKNPHFPVENRELINALTSVDTSELAPRLDHWLLDARLPTPQVLEIVSQKLSPAARKDAIELLVELGPRSTELATDLQTAKKIPELHARKLRQDVHVWAELFAKPNLSSTRQSLADWSLTPEFTEFCDVLSDSPLTSKAYNFLESVNHDPNSKPFLESCREILDLH